MLDLACQSPRQALTQPRLKVVLVAFSARNALQQTLDAIFESLEPHLDCHVLVPTNYDGAIPASARLHLECGTSRLGGTLASFNPLSHWQIASALRDIQPDVVHLFSGEGYPWALTLRQLLALTRVPLIVTLHDADPHPGSLIERLNAVIRFPVLRSAQAIHLFSSTSIPKARDLAPNAQLSVIAHGSLAGRFIGHKQQDVPRERLVLFFGRIEHYKGIDVLCQAVARLAKDVRLAIAGPGRLDKTTQELVAQLGGRVELHNAFLDDASVALLMQRAGVVALPYRHVTQSSVPGIAAAFGVPVVASSLGNFVEEVPALGGQLVPVEDPIALAASLAALLDAPAKKLPQAPTFAELAPAFVELYRAAALRQCPR